MRSKTERGRNRWLRTSIIAVTALVSVGTALADQVSDQENLLAEFNNLLSTPGGVAYLDANLQEENTI